MNKAHRFPFVEVPYAPSEVGSLPYLPLTLAHQNQALSVSGLLDTGSTVNVMPYDMGITLGAIWEMQTKSISLTGNLANLEARVLIVSASVGQFSPVRLAFAWTQAKEVPLILGQVNFFLEFDVCFYRSQSFFEVKLK